MGIGKSKITPSINIDDMLKKVESSHEIEAEKQDADKRLTEIREAKEALLKIHQDLLDAIKAEGEAAMVLQKAISSSNHCCPEKFYHSVSCLGPSPSGTLAVRSV